MGGTTTGQNANSKMRFGVFEFDAQARELFKHGTRLKVQEQPIQILAALLEQAGQIVSREELQRRLWPDGTFVDFEQSLNKAVNKLREALGDSADHPIYVETLARRGYRFLAPVERNEAAPPALPATVPRRRVWPWLAVGGFLLAGILGTGLWPIGVPQVERVVQLTNDASSKYLPFVSDGSRVFFSDGTSLWSVPASGGEPKRVPLPFLPQSLWSLHIGGSSRPPQNILLVSERNEGGAREMWLFRPDGQAPRKISEAHGYVGLAPDGMRFAESMPDGVYVQANETGERKKIGSFQWGDGPGPVWWHPSGRILGLGDTVQPGSKARVWQMNEDGTHFRRIVPEIEQGQGAGAWSPDGRRFYYGSLEKDEEIYVRTQAGILGWLRKSAVARLTTSGQFGHRPAVDPVNQKRLYVDGVTSRTEIMRYDRAARKWVSFLSGVSGAETDRSPDGQWMVYAKFPSAELHKCKLDGSADVVLASGVKVCNPHWSPDGKRIAFAGVGTKGSLKLWLVSANGGDAAPYRPEIESGPTQFGPTTGRKYCWANIWGIWHLARAGSRYLIFKPGNWSRFQAASGSSPRAGHPMGS